MSAGIQMGEAGLVAGGVKLGWCWQEATTLPKAQEQTKVSRRSNSIGKMLLNLNLVCCIYTILVNLIISGRVE